MRPRRHIPKPNSIGVAEAKAQLAMLLCGCTDERLASFTPEYLAGNHRVPVRECEYALMIERQRRAAR